MKRTFFVLVLLIGLTTVISLKEIGRNSNKLAKLKTRLDSLTEQHSSAQLTEKSLLDLILGKLTNFSLAEKFESLIDRLKFWSLTGPDEEGSGRNDEEFVVEMNIEEEDDHYLDVYKLLQYLGLTNETFQPVFEFSVWALQNAGQIPMVMDVLNTILQDIIAMLPLDTINELVDLVPWQSLDHALATADNTNVEKVKELIDDFKPFVKKVLELYEMYYGGNNQSMVALLKFAVSRRIAELSAKGQRNCSTKKIVCYYPNWTYYRKGLGRFVVDDIDTSLCTHFIYAFAVLDGERHVMKAHDIYIDTDRSGGVRGWNKGFFRKFTALKKKNPHAKYLLALGGWNDSTKAKYSELLADPAKIARFVSHALGFVKEYGFDGLDLDYEYPAYDGHGHDAPDSDRLGFTLLCRALSEAFRPEGLELTAAVSASDKVILAGYEVSKVCSYLDSVHVMAYDLHGQWEKNVNHHATLYGEDWDPLTVDHGANVWVEQGCPKEKLIIGIPTYGRSWTLGSWSNPVIEYNINATALGGGQNGPLTRAKGFLAYHEICNFIINEGWTKVSDPTLRMGPYAYKGNQWVSYDDVEMVREKARYIINNQFGGAMVWDLSTDDFNNVCGGGRSPLITTISQIVKSQTSCSAPRRI